MIEVKAHKDGTATLLINGFAFGEGIVKGKLILEGGASPKMELEVVRRRYKNVIELLEEAQVPYATTLHGPENWEDEPTTIITIDFNQKPITQTKGRGLNGEFYEV